MNIINIIQELRGGQTLLELNDEAANVVKQVEETNRAGSITLTITIKPGGGNKMVVTDKIGKSLPVADRASTLFFANEDHSLTRQMPGQVSLGVLEGLDR